MNTSIQMRKQKTHKAVNKKLYNLRDKANQILERERLKINKNIIVLFDKKRPLTSPKAKELPKKIQKSEAERKSELKKINSAITVYTKRIEAINPPDDEQKRKRILKMEEKLKELLKKREELKEAKEVPETRGKKQKIHFVEFELSITMSNEWKNNEEFVKTFQNLQTQFLKNKFFADLELELNVVHLDQFSLHSHAMFKLPEGKTFDTHLRELNRDGRKAYEIINRMWHTAVEKELKAKFGIELDEMESGKRYISLRDFKKQKPVQILEKEEKINPSSNLSDLSSNMRARVERAEQIREQVNSISKKEKTSEALQSNTQVTESNTEKEIESQNNRRKNR